MVSISTLIQKIKSWPSFRPQLHILSDELFVGLVIILVAFGSFGLGRLSKIEGSKTPIQIENALEVTPDTFKGNTQTADTQNISSLDGSVDVKTAQLVGSKTGKKYHYIWCPGAQKIAEANRRYFSSKTDAEAQGYTPASNCKGL